MAESTNRDHDTTPPLRRASRREVGARVDPRDVARRRLLLGGAMVAVAGVVAAWYVVTAGRPPGGPVAELQRFAVAMDDRDVDAMLALWEPGADASAVRAQIELLFGQVGGAGMTPAVEPPRVRTVDATTYRGLHRMGEVDLETMWVWDGERFRLTRLDLAR